MTPLSQMPDAIEAAARQQATIVELLNKGNAAFGGELFEQAERYYRQYWQKAYNQDCDVELAQFQAVADPQVNVLHEGVVLDVRPTIHHDRKYIRLEIQPTVAKVVALEPFSSPLGGHTSPGAVTRRVGRQFSQYRGGQCGSYPHRGRPGRLPVRVRAASG